MHERSIAAPDLITAMRWFVSNVESPASTPYLLSIDHSPSEQIDGSEWHHSALIMSPNIEHQNLADVLGEKLNPSIKILKQWKSTDQRYRKNFHQEFFHELKNHPILAIVVSAKESAVLSNEQDLAQELEIANHYRRVELDGQIKVEFGPYVGSDEDLLETLVITSKQAPMAIFNANYLRRIHSALKAAACEKLGVGASDFNLWIQVMSDKPPNDFGGRYAKLIWLLLGGPSTHGRFTWGGFTGNEDQPIDLLADNLAGLFNDITLYPENYQYKGPDLQPPVKGVFYWERLE